MAGGSADDSEVDRKICDALAGEKEWVLVGGPPCQAYSIVGRVRNGGIKASDPKVGLYKEYLRIVAKFQPTVFVMENVRGLLSANLEGSIFERILSDLRKPGERVGIATCPGYRLHSFVEPERGREIDGTPVYDPIDYLIRSEDYGIPQARHRVILLGIRSDVEVVPGQLRKNPEKIGRAATPARKREFKLQHPSYQKFTKTDLAKALNAWAQLPHLVCLGAEKNFVEFTDRCHNEKIEPTELHFRHLVADLILFRTAEKVVQKQAFGGYRSQIIAYTLAWISHNCEHAVDHDVVWRQQTLSEELQELIATVSMVAHHHLVETADGRNVTEWAKKEECWTAFKTPTNHREV